MDCVVERIEYTLRSFGKYHPREFSLRTADKDWSRIMTLIMRRKAPAEFLIFVEIFKPKGKDLWPFGSFSESANIVEPPWVTSRKRPPNQNPDWFLCQSNCYYWNFHKRPPPISNHLSLTSRVVAYGRFHCIYFSILFHKSPKLNKALPKFHEIKPITWSHCVDDRLWAMNYRHVILCWIRSTRIGRGAGIGGWIRCRTFTGRVRSSLIDRTPNNGCDLIGGNRSGRRRPDLSAFHVREKLVWNLSQHFFCQ